MPTGVDLSKATKCAKFIIIQFNDTGLLSPIIRTPKEIEEKRLILINDTYVEYISKNISYIGKIFLCGGKDFLTLRIISSFIPLKNLSTFL